MPAQDEAAWVLHVDLDQFIAAVEIQRHPELRGKPVVVGGTGDPTQRAVVSTASYEAREFGVHSGMPLRTAAKKCPDAVFLAVDAPAYEAVSERVMATLREFPVVVEVLGWDEAFLGAHTDDPEALAAAIRVGVREATGLSCSVGIGDNKLRAKLATGLAKPTSQQSGKPAGIYRLTRDNWVAVMADRPTDALWGIGSRTCAKLADEGLRTVADLARADPQALAARFGPKMGPWYRQLALGAGEVTVDETPYVPKGCGREVTYQENLTEPAEISAQLESLARRLTDDVHADGRPAARIGIKVRFAPFFTTTRSLTLPEPTGDPDVVAAAAAELLTRVELGRPIRLLGVRAEFPAE
ncbi:MAG TPA: DNA polymerase IV [Pseudonocardiaceae bacterium]|nr:DNA polymerase IV [Pseudonocardiaceae bacterium]